MEQTFITKIAMVILALIVITLLMGFYQQFAGLLNKDADIQKTRDEDIRRVFEEAHAKLFIVLIQYPDFVK
jgi:hypothetical protein